MQKADSFSFSVQNHTLQASILESTNKAEVRVKVELPKSVSETSGREFKPVTLILNANVFNNIISIKKECKEVFNNINLATEHQLHQAFEGGSTAKEVKDKYENFKQNKMQEPASNQREEPALKDKDQIRGTFSSITRDIAGKARRLSSNVSSFFKNFFSPNASPSNAAKDESTPRTQSLPARIAEGVASQSARARAVTSSFLQQTSNQPIQPTATSSSNAAAKASLDINKKLSHFDKTLSRAIKSGNPPIVLANQQVYKNSNVLSIAIQRVQGDSAGYANILTVMSKHADQVLPNKEEAVPLTPENIKTIQTMAILLSKLKLSPGYTAATGQNPSLKQLEKNVSDLFSNLKTSLDAEVKSRHTIFSDPAMQKSFLTNLKDFKRDYNPTSTEDCVNKIIEGNKGVQELAIWGHRNNSLLKNIFQTLAAKMENSDNEAKQNILTFCNEHLTTNVSLPITDEGKANLKKQLLSIVESAKNDPALAPLASQLNQNIEATLQPALAKTDSLAGNQKALKFSDITPSQMYTEMAVLLEKDFLNINVAEFDELAWSKPGLKDSATTLNQIISHFNTMSSLMEMHIVQAANIKESVAALDEILAKGAKALEDGNISLAMTVSTTLGKSSIDRLLKKEQYKAEISDANKDIIMKLAFIGDPTSNYSNLRMAANAALLSGQRVIPSMNYFFTDVTFSKEGNEQSTKADSSVNISGPALIAQSKRTIKAIQELNQNQTTSGAQHQDQLKEALTNLPDEEALYQASLKLIGRE